MKLILDCPYEQRNQAKALGARWDPALKKWYVIDPPDLAPFAPWLPTDAAEFIGRQNEAAGTGAPAHPKAPKKTSPPQRQSRAPAQTAPSPLAPWPVSGSTADDEPPWD
jgi:hypothetical protein